MTIYFVTFWARMNTAGSYRKREFCGIKVWPYCTRIDLRKIKQATVVGILFNGIEGNLTYYKDGRYLGVAFQGLDKVSPNNNSRLRDCLIIISFCLLYKYLRLRICMVPW